MLSQINGVVVIQRLAEILAGRAAYLVMSSALVLCIYFYFYSQPSPLEEKKTYFENCQVQQIIDGDSVVVDCQGRNLHLRLVHIDAPEMPQNPWGEQSKQALHNYLLKPFNVRLSGQDIYNRYLATLISQGAEVNLALVEQGNARVYSRYQPPARYRKAMKAAKSQQLGIWQKSGLQQNPQRWRRLSQ